MSWNPTVNSPIEVYTKSGCEREGVLESLAEVLDNDDIRINIHNASDLIPVDGRWPNTHTVVGEVDATDRPMSDLTSST